jgi:hypothetical protein
VAAFARRDLGAVEAVLGDPLETIEHPTGTTYGRAGQLESSKRMMRHPNLEFRGQTLATLGDSLCLFRRLVTASGTAGGRFDVGEYEIESIILNEVDGAGRLRRSEVFGSDRLCRATVRLYERWAETLPDGPERTRAAGIARSYAACDGPLDADRVGNVASPSYVCVDHRSLGTWSGKGLDEWRRHWRGQAELAAGFSRRDDDILAFAPAVNVTRHTYVGTNRELGGPFENVILTVNMFDAEGLYERVEVFEPDQEAAALARFDDLIGGARTPPREERFANASTRLMERFVRATAARDWQSLADLFAPSLRFDDRRPLLRIELPQESFLEQHRTLFDAPNARWATTSIATRGERLLLARLLFEGDVEGGGGALEIDHLSILEVGDDGRWSAVVLFEPNDLDAAYAELDARYETAEAAAYLPCWKSMQGFVRAVERRDWDAIIALCAASLVEYDHRSLAVIGTTRGAEAWAENFRTLADLSPDTIYRVDHFRSAAGGYYVHGGWHGTREGGAYEIPLNAVIELDDRGLIVRADIYDDDGVEAALARFAELAVATASPHPFANAATRGFDRGLAALGERDWQGFAALFAKNARVYDRTSTGRYEADGPTWLAAFREMIEMTSGAPTPRVLATRGERLMLGRALWRGAAGDVGPSEVDWLLIIEVDERGDHHAIVAFNPSDLDAAYRELEARYEAGEAAEHRPVFSEYQRAVAARDWDALAAFYGPSFVEQDHRAVAVLGTARGAEVWTQHRALVELAPDTQVRFDHIRHGARGFLIQGTWHGSRDGGRYEITFVIVVELDDRGTPKRNDIYDPEQLDQAFARFEAMGVAADPLAVIAKPNAAFALELWQAAFDAGAASDDWDAMRDRCAAGMIFEDRRHLALLSGDREMMVASARERKRAGGRPEFRLVGTAGDRVFVSRVLWSGGPPEGRWEIEYLAVLEIDEAGAFTGIIFFDLADARAAQREAWARWAAIDPAAAAVTASLGEGLDAFNAHDRTRFRAIFADDLIVEDHRRTGMGRLEGSAAYAASVAALWDLSAESRIDGGWFWPVYDWYGAVTVNRRFGTTLAGGGEFESELLYLFTVAGGRITRVEMFEIEDLEAALSRFEELRPARQPEEESA